VDENGLPRTEWYLPESANLVLSPYVIDVEVQHNFHNFMVTSRAMSIELMPNEEELKGRIKGKIFVNNKLLTEFSNIYWWITTISYDNKSKIYIVKTSDGNEFQTAKLD
jgi:hypothetical protein